MTKKTLKSSKTVEKSLTLRLVKALAPHFEREELLGELQKCSDRELLHQFFTRIEQNDRRSFSPPPVEDETTRQIPYLIARLSQFARIYMKNALAESEVQSPEEFGFLMALPDGRSMAKSDLIREQLIEIPTGMDMLRRMQIRGLIEESEAQPDRRSKWIQRTKKGSLAAKTCLEKLTPVIQVISAELKTGEQSELTSILQRLDRFHTHLTEHPEWPNARLMTQTRAEAPVVLKRV